MATVSLTFDSVSRLVDIIEALRHLGQSIEYGKLEFDDDVDGDTMEGTKDIRLIQLKKIIYLLLDERNTKLVKYVLEDINMDNEDNLLEMTLEYMKDSNHQNLFPKIENLKLLFSMLVSKNVEFIIRDRLGDRAHNHSVIFTYYSNNPLPEIIDWIILNLRAFFKPDEIPKIVFKGIVQRINRQDFYDKVKQYNAARQDEQDKWMKAYDKAAKERAIEVSLGLGYAQLDNQVHSTIPSLVLQQIVDESADLSGMPAWQVYQIVKHINEGTTDKTVRLGVPSNFEDARDN